MKIILTKGIVRFKNKYLLLKKAKDILPENNGKWECTGGRIKEGEKPENVMLREAKRETGLNCKIIKELPFISMKDENYDSNCYVFLLEADSEQVKLSEDHSEFYWVTPEKVKEMELVKFANLLLEYFNNPEMYLE